MTAVVTHHIKRPEHEAVKQIEGIVADIAILEAETANRVRALQEQLKEQVLALAEIEDRNERLAIVRYLYWAEFEGVRANDLATALVGSHKYAHHMRSMVGPIGTYKCKTEGCNERIAVASRTQAEYVRKFGDLPNYGRTGLCETCYSQAHPTITAEEWKREKEEARERRIREDEELEKLQATSNLPTKDLVRMFHLMANAYLRQPWEDSP